MSSVPQKEELSYTFARSMVQISAHCTLRSARRVLFYSELLITGIPKLAVYVVSILWATVCG